MSHIKQNGFIYLSVLIFSNAYERKVLPDEVSNSNYNFSVQIIQTVLTLKLQLMCQKHSHNKHTTEPTTQV
jgi:hypothetical protein